MSEASTEGPKLRTARLLLRPFRPADAGDISKYLGDPLFLRFLGEGFNDAREIISNHDGIDWKETCGFAIDLDGTVIGSVHLGSERPRMIGELALLMSPAYWRQGFGAEACVPTIDYGFDVLRLEKVYAGADARNIGSIRTMEKLGMKREALLRSHRVTREGERVDEVLYGLLKAEW